MAMFGALIDDALERWEQADPVGYGPWGQRTIKTGRRREVLFEYIAEHIARTGFAPAGWHTVESAHIHFSPALASDSHSET